MIIRKMTEQDVPKIYRAEMFCFSQAWSEKSIRTEIDNPRCISLTAEYESDIAGYLFAGYVLDEVYLNRLAVSEKYRRMGVASELLKELEREVAEFGAFITLEVRKSNTAGIQLYMKNGFQPVGERINFYEMPVENAVLMTKFLKQKD